MDRRGFLILSGTAATGLALTWSTTEPGPFPDVVAGRVTLEAVDHLQTRVEELWFSKRMRVMFGNAIRIGDHLYGVSGDFGPAFLTALDIKTGEVAWQERGFGRSSLIYADGKAIIMDEDGSLILARISPAGVKVLAKTHLFDTTSWSVPSLVGATLYARDRAKIVALDLGGPGGG